MSIVSANCALASHCLQEGVKVVSLNFWHSVILLWIQSRNCFTIGKWCHAAQRRGQLQSRGHSDRVICWQTIKRRKKTQKCVTLQKTMKHTVNESQRCVSIQNPDDSVSLPCLSSYALRLLLDSIWRTRVYVIKSIRVRMHRSTSSCIDKFPTFNSALADIVWGNLQWCCLVPLDFNYSPNTHKSTNKPVSLKLWDCKVGVDDHRENTELKEVQWIWSMEGKLKKKNKKSLLVPSCWHLFHWNSALNLFNLLFPQ